MQPPVRDLLARLARDPQYADRYFADPDAVLDGLDVDPADREALRHLDREATGYLAVAADHEPRVAAEHARGGGNSWAAPLIGLWACAAYILLWLWWR
jgi:hypothetical protein